MVGLRDGENAGIGARHRAASSISTDRPLKRPTQVPAPPTETSRLRASPPGTFTNGCELKLPRSGFVQFASSYERVTWIGLPKYASYDPTDAGVNIASNTLACFSARLGLLPLVALHSDFDKFGNDVVPRKSTR
jgi:hypothetical protein